MTIACVIVTYNRKTLLKRCLTAVNNQTFKPSVVYITDNASSDGTMDSVKEWGYYNCINNCIEYKYILNSRNEGGAGGFYLGMKTAMNDGEYDAIWVMDDDGEPECNCLCELAKYLGTYDYISPIVLSDEDRKSCSFTFEHESIEVFLSKMNVKNGIIQNYSNPFNGILYSKKYIEVVGYPKKEMFIWGDEINYRMRGENIDLLPVTVVNAIHYHPVNKKEYVWFNGHRIVETNTDWKLYCFLRNYWYNNMHVYKYRSKGRYYHPLREAFVYWKYFSKVKNTNKFILIADAYLSAVFGNFTRLNKYFD